MESLVRRLRRKLFPRKKAERKAPSRRVVLQVERIEKALEAWSAGKGWRRPGSTLGDVAEELGIDTSTLYHYFEDYVGMDFRTWRTRLRLEDACRMLLEEPDACAADIGLRAGFSNRSNFARQFRAHLGCTPAQWRSQEIPSLRPE